MHINEVGTLTIYDGCDTSANQSEFFVRNSKLPPGGGRAAAGSTSGRRRRRSETQPAQRKSAKWVALVRLGGATDRYSAQLGKQVVYFDGALSVSDLLAALSMRGARAGDET